MATRRGFLSQLSCFLFRTWLKGSLLVAVVPSVVYHVRHGVCEVSESIICGRDSGINFLLVLESGVFAGHAERSGQQGDGGRPH